MDIQGAKPVANQAAKKRRTGSPGLRRTGIGMEVGAGEKRPLANQPLRSSTGSRAANHKEFPLPRYLPPARPLKVIQKRRKQITKGRLLLRGMALCGVVVVTIGGLLAWNGYVKIHKVFHGTSTVAALSSRRVTPGLLKGEGDGRVNILLLGIGGPGHDGPDLTDTIMLLSVDPVNNSAALLSIPRDLWVQQPIPYFGKTQKINAAYESGKYHYLRGNSASNTNTAALEVGFANLDQVIKNVTGVNVDYHVLVNFQAFKQAIDTVGGVTVDVPSPLYDPTMAWENHGNPVLTPAGVQQMGGIEALLYARSRETTSDFARSQRQRQILVALKDKVFTAGTLSNPAKIDALTNAFGDNVYSDLSTQGAERLYSIMKKVGDGKISSIGLTDPPHQLIKTGSVGTTSVDLPIAGLDNYTDIQQYVRGQLPDGYIVREHAPVTIVSKTATGSAATAALLKSYGYDVTAALTTDQPVNQLTLVDLSGGKAPFTGHYLENRYSVKAADRLPPGISVSPGSAEFVIIEP